MMENYERIGRVGRPVYLANETVQVKFGMGLIFINSMGDSGKSASHADATVKVWNKYVSINRL